MLSFIESDGTVDNPQLLPVGVGPASIAAADLNGDQKADLVITDAEAGNIYVEIATGGGLFASPVTYSLGTQPGALALADLNGDGKPDVIAGDATALDVLIGKGDGTLDPVKTFPVRRKLEFRHHSGFQFRWETRCRRCQCGKWRGFTFHWQWRRHVPRRPDNRADRQFGSPFHCDRRFQRRRPCPT